MEKWTLLHAQRQRCLSSEKINHSLKKRSLSIRNVKDASCVHSLGDVFFMSDSPLPQGAPCLLPVASTCSHSLRILTGAHLWCSFIMPASTPPPRGFLPLPRVRIACLKLTPLHTHTRGSLLQEASTHCLILPCLPYLIQRQSTSAAAVCEWCNRHMHMLHFRAHKRWL